MGRFLFYFSYVGTRYRGLQRQSTTGIDDTIQGRLVDFTRDVLGRDLSDPTATLSSLVSSRTDVGVHALNNTITVDFPDRKQNGQQHDLMMIQKILNMRLGKKGEEIRVHSIQQVADNFRCFSKPYRRHYIYRLGIFKDSAYVSSGTPLPIIDRGFVHLLHPPFSMDKFLQAAEVMCGTNNFTSFTSVKKITEEFKNPVRTVSINIKRGAPYMAGSTEECQEKLEFWDVHIISKSFMYKQIRRMVNGLVAVACGKCSVEDLRQTLKDPAHKVKYLERSFPPWALFLNNVEYYPEDLIYPGPLPELQKEYRTLSKTLEKYLHLQGNSDGIKDRTLDTINVPDSCHVLNNEESTKSNENNSINKICDSVSLHCVERALTLNEFSVHISQNVCRNESVLTSNDEIVDSAIQINSKG
ncbi:tRNA pseudouridine synthase-like 1 isoform X1 [Mytilus californianus]|uniref:tRNA pseudouridine synthase-like 1 isoform X1 n=1 Tax=Mytilus californianus TaxID=6549 RepID=UPI002247322F|nr:tRNA pseudouridine synthase-like 1 isoform X1 [Mytilus californianus]